MMRVIKDNNGTVVGIYRPYRQGVYMNRETGELLNFKDARKQFRDEYDGEDDTNPTTFDDLYMFVEG